MIKGLEEIIITHGAPTLAGLKCGSLLFWRGAADARLTGYLRDLNAQLAPKGVRVRLLRGDSAHALVYVYRPAMLQRVLGQEQVRAFLMKCGFEDLSLEGSLHSLSQRLRSGGPFPHEVGVFLDYPLADVIGFIRQPRCSNCHVGYWKAYTDQEAARRRFSLYRKCREVYRDCYRRGFGLSRLTVAA